jgi:hypothetical protein
VSDADRATRLLPTRSLPEESFSPSSTTRPAPPDAEESAELFGLPMGTALHLPLDLVVPLRSAIGNAVLDDVSLRTRFLLLHMDGVSSLADIAAAACLSRGEVVGAFLELLDLGVVELHTRAEVAGVPISGIYRGGMR